MIESNITNFPRTEDSRRLVEFQPGITAPAIMQLTQACHPLSGDSVASIGFDWDAATDACRRGVARGLAGFGIRDPELVSDLTQDAFMEVLASASRVGFDVARGNGAGLMYIVGKRMAWRHGRRQKQRGVAMLEDAILDVLSSTCVPSDDNDVTESAALHHAIKLLPPAERFAVEVTLEYRSMTDSDEPRSGTFRSALSRGRKRLKRWVPQLVRLLEDHPRPYQAEIHAYGRGLAVQFTVAR